MITREIRTHLFECIAGTTDGNLSVSGSGSMASFTIPVNIPGIEATATDGRSVEVSIPDADQSTPTLDGGLKVEEGSVMAVVVSSGTDGGSHLERQRLYAAAEAVAAECPVGVVTAVGSASVQITARPSIRALYRDDESWRLPVVIRYRASGAS